MFLRDSFPYFPPFHCLWFWNQRNGGLRINWGVFIPLQFSGRLYENQYYSFLKILVGFINEAIWAWKLTQGSKLDQLYHSPYCFPFLGFYCPLLPDVQQCENHVFHIYFPIILVLSSGKIIPIHIILSWLETKILIDLISII